MSAAISSLLGALIGGLAAIGGSWLQGRNAARLRRAESMEHLQERQRLIARRYLYQLGDAVDSLRTRVDNWANRGGLEYTKELYPEYWEVTSLYAVARALGAERILDLEGVYVELHALSSGEAAEFPRHAVEDAVKEAFGFLRYHRLALAEAVLDRADDEFRVLIYSEFVRRYEDPQWNLKLLLEPARRAFDSIDEEHFEKLERSLGSFSKCIEDLTTPHNASSVEVR